MLVASLWCALGMGGAMPPGGQAVPPDPNAWTDHRPDLSRQVVKRRNHRWPLSDQANRAGWAPDRRFWDEFGGARLDPERWWDHNPTWKGRQPAAFLPSNVRVRDGQLHLTMRKEEPPEELRKEGYHTYTSAAVQSKERVLYGYFEVRARAMKSHGSSAFWFYFNEPERWTEIDVFEIAGGKPEWDRRQFITVHVMHTPEDKKHRSVGSHFDAPFRLADDFHVYGLEWDEKELRFFLDGALVRSGPNTHWHQPLTINFDSETMPDWFGLPLDKDLPSTYSIDYLRVWRKLDAGGRS